MDTDSLRLFVLSAEMLNISAAGRTLGMAPAASSARLAKLEHEIGTQLLHRSTRKVSISIEGADFLPFAREILAQHEAGLAALGRGKPRIAGTLRFAASSTFAKEYIAPLLPELLALYPDLKLDLRLSDLPLDLIEGSFDLALRSAPLTDSSFKMRKLADDTRILVAAPGYLAEHGSPVAPGDLADHHLIGFRHDAPRPLRGLDGKETAFDPAAAGCRLIVDDGASQRAATVAGAGISMNSLWGVDRDLRAGRLERVLPDYVIDDQAVLALVYPKSNVISPKVRALIDFLIERIGSDPPWLRA